MAGLYIHVPFCKQACRYCDFYFTVSLKYRDEYTYALLSELQMRSDFFEGEALKTVYFGGGTPTLLSLEQLGRIMDTISKKFTISSDPELTIEANPDDLSQEYVKDLHKLGFNRLSIGIQSFRDTDLELMRRSHTAAQALESIENARALFNNINIDLIYGLPAQTLEDWEYNIKQALSLEIEHLSAYYLTFEPGTVFDHWRKKGRISELSEQLSVEQYWLLKEKTGIAGYEHYEISNFAKQGFRSQHNTSYWDDSIYLGVGPSAHSYNRSSRYWNISSLKEYILRQGRGESCFEAEILSPKDKLNDYILTALRTSSGADMQKIRTRFGNDVYKGLMERAQVYIKNEDMFMEGEILIMSANGWLRSDMIIQALMV